MTRTILVLLLIITFAATGIAQQRVFNGQVLRSSAYPELQDQFFKSDVFQMNVPELDQFSRNQKETFSFSLHIGGFEWEIELQAHDLRSENYKLTVLSQDGERNLSRNRNITYQGKLLRDNNSKVSLTIMDDFIYGFIGTNDELIFIEPLSYFVQNAPKDQYVLYSSRDVKPTNLACGLTEMEKRTPDSRNQTEGIYRAAGNCYVIQLAIASDRAMFNKYGSVSAVEAHNLGVMNNVKANYDDEFSDGINFEVVQVYVVTAVDPWSATTDAGELLRSFTTWGPSGFSNAHDLGQLWTARDFDGNTIGIAWLSTLCSTHRYHCLQDFTSNANSLRVMTAHEIGHNLSADHDPSGSPTIMAPAVNNSSSWSSISISAISNHVASKAPPGGCLSNCSTGSGGGGSAPTANFSGSPVSGCSPLQVTFTNTSTGGATSWNWSFPGGNPSTSTSQNPVVQYSVPGTYSVTLTATNANGSNTITRSNYISVTGSPAANFGFTMNGRTVSFSNTSSNATSYTWNFGDGITSNIVNPVYTYNSDGSFLVILTAFNACGSSSKSVVITVTSPPVANFTATPQSGCAPLQVSFTNQSSGASSWLWSFPGGSPSSSTDQHPSVQYSSPGNYSVTLTATNSAGSATITKTNFINASGGPATDFTYSVNGRTVTFTNTSSGASSQVWNFGDGTTSTISNPVYTFAADGTYQVTLSATSNCGTTNITKNVTVMAPPSANFSASPTSGCAPLQVSFTNLSSTTASSWLWSFPGGNPSSSTAKNPVVQYSSTGTYSVTLTAYNAGGSHTFTRTNFVTATGNPNTNFSYSMNGRTVSFANLSTNSISYSWNFGDGNSSTATNPSHTYNSDGSFIATLTATNSCGSIPNFKTLIISTPPSANFTASPTTGCAPLQVAFTNTSSANTNSLSWSFPGGTPATSTANNPIVQYPSPGTYSVMLTAMNSVGSHTTSKTNYITAGGKPSSIFTYTSSGRSVSFANNSTNADSYSWNFGDGNSSSAINPTHTFAQDENYTVTLSTSNSCGTSTYSTSVSIATMPEANFSASATSGCSPFQVSFQNQSSSNATSWLWSFPGGSPSSSTDKNPVVWYQGAGTFQVSLTATNATGSNSVSKSNFISVGNKPIADFSYTINGRKVSLINVSTNATSYSWTFGDGNTSQTQQPQHTFELDGTYLITLTAYNNCGSSSKSSSVYIATPPVADFTHSTSMGCPALQVQFDNKSSVNASSWLWSFPGGNPSSSTLKNPLVTYANEGSYSVTLVATNSAGSHTISKNSIIQVYALPLPMFSQRITGKTVSFVNASLNASTYFWDFGDGNTSSSTEPTHTYAQEGNYQVTLRATNSCSTISQVKTIHIILPPTAGFSAAVTKGCMPFKVKFENKSSANTTSFVWQFPDGIPATSNLPNPEVTYETAGFYNVSLTVSNSAGTHSDSKTSYITVGPLPVSGFSFSTNGLQASFFNTSTNSETYNWNFGDGSNLNNSHSPSHNFAKDGNYTVVLKASNFCGTDSTIKTLNIVTPPKAEFMINSSNGCAPVTVKYVNQSTQNATGYQWYFPGGNPSASTDQNPEVTYAQAGVYEARLIASNAAGSGEKYKPDLLTVGKAPVADFSANITGTKVLFTNNSTGASSYQWNFGSGTASSTQANPEYNFQSDGIYTIILTATNGCGSHSLTKEIKIVTPPMAAFSANSTEGCAPFTVSYNNGSSSNATSWLWSFPGGIPDKSGEKNPLVVYVQPGIYEATLTALNSAGQNIFTRKEYIKVKPKTVAEFSIKTDSLTVTLSNSTADAQDFLWKFGDGATSIAANPTHRYSEDGTYTIQLEARNECSVSTSSKQVVLSTPPKAQFSANKLTGCMPVTVQFSNSSSKNAKTFSWTFPGGTPSASNDPNPTVTYDSAGVFDVILIAKNEAGSHQYEMPALIKVKTKPSAIFSVVVDKSLVTLETKVEKGFSYLWSFGDGTKTQEPNPVYQYSKDGNYTISLTAINECGISTSSQTVTIAFEKPVAGAKVENKSGCKPLVVNFENTSSPNSKSWLWTFPGGSPASSTARNPMVIYQQPGTYDVVLIAYNDIGTDTVLLKKYIEVNSAPMVSFDYTIDKGEVSFTNQSSGALSYLWLFGKAGSSTEVNPVFTFTSTGPHEIVLTATNVCGQANQRKVITLNLTNTFDKSDSLWLKAYPNPTSGILHLEIKALVAKRIEIYFSDITGKILHSQTIEYYNEEFQQNLDFSHLPAGMYVLRVKSGESSHYRKIVVE